MTVFRAFTHEFNAREVARQEYELAAAHCREVVRHGDRANPAHRERVRDAKERRAAARERYVAVLSG